MTDEELALRAYDEHKDSVEWLCTVSSRQEFACAWLFGYRARAAEPPQPASVGGVCPKCHGTGSIPNGTDEMACGACTGSGKLPHPTDEELIGYLRRAVNAAIFGIPPEAIPAVQEQISELARRLPVKP